MKKIKILIVAILSLGIGAFVGAQVNTIFSPPWQYVGVPATVSTMLNAVQPYHKIVMRVTQSSTSAPVDTTVEDNESTAHSLIRLGTGNYRLICNDAFNNNTLIFPGNTVADCDIRAWVIDADSIGIQTTDSSATVRDSKLLNTPFEIRLYPN